MPDITVTGFRLPTFPNGFFGVNSIVFSPSLPSLPATTIGGVLAAISTSKPTTIVKFNKTDTTPDIEIEQPTTDSAKRQSIRIDAIGTLISQAAKDPRVAAALQEMRTNNVTYRIVVQNSFTSDQRALIRSDDGDPDNIRGFTPLPASANRSQLAEGSTVTTIVLSSYTRSLQEFGSLIGHELLHVSRTANGTFWTDEQAVLRQEPDTFRSIFRNKTIDRDGSTSESGVIDIYSGNNLIYGTAGNDIIRAFGGNNTIVTYESNSFLQGAGGNDYYDVQGKGAKAITDSGGQNTLYAAWLGNGVEIRAKRIGNDLILSDAATGISPELDPDRIGISDFYKTYKIGTFGITVTTASIQRFTIPTAAGVVSYDFKQLADRLVAGGSIRGAPPLALASIRTLDATAPDATNEPSKLNIIGTPVTGFEDRYAAQSAAARLAQAISGFDVKSAFSVGLREQDEDSLSIASVDRRGFNDGRYAMALQ
jgi:RTX calcium-binding nonapeptide repeat (4 copies)